MRGKPLAVRLPTAKTRHVKCLQTPGTIEKNKHEGLETSSMVEFFPGMRKTLDSSSSTDKAKQ